MELCQLQEMDETWEYKVKWMKPGSERQICIFTLIHGRQTQKIYTQIQTWSYIYIYVTHMSYIYIYEREGKKEGER
jgi:hypothetical protein